ncbi:MAG: GNAT family N-acetyltransferase [Sulfurospirillaceae bacterium]|nr:GNAT family N-acetyltransferase [Sulfurospirillaceae bacterium]
MTCRTAVKEDIPHLCRLLNQLFEQEAEFEPNTKDQAYALSEIIKDKRIGEVFVVLINDKIVGMVNILYTISTALGAKVAMLEDMIVDKNYRGEDLGSFLLDYTLKKIKADGCKRVTLLTDGDNAKAHRFYENSGFARSGMIPFRILL